MAGPSRHFGVVDNRQATVGKDGHRTEWFGGALAGPNPPDETVEDRQGTPARTPCLSHWWLIAGPLTQGDEREWRVRARAVFPRPRGANRLPRSGPPHSQRRPVRLIRTVLPGDRTVLTHGSIGKGASTAHSSKSTSRSRANQPGTRLRNRCRGSWTANSRPAAPVGLTAKTAHPESLSQEHGQGCSIAPTSARPGARRIPCACTVRGHLPRNIQPEAPAHRPPLHAGENAVSGNAQAPVGAVIHCNFSHTKSILPEVVGDRIEVKSPGTPPSSMTVAQEDCDGAPRSRDDMEANAMASLPPAPECDESGKRRSPSQGLRRVIRFAERGRATSGARASCPTPSRVSKSLSRRT